ncbi:putative serine/threonine-protein kinase DDB_G0267514 [Dictyostelium discoideum] [Rhizoctonia solani]|uniref:Putative serine/threonine-protein kinase DDB_G0267514 [Dictyostelium discoideum] n=1 Tax=Rhizoctonia solani TaxID=456999 RepID=A0A0K6G5B1_9AGAM|nr:putative serine/threonine-protein kinase DDB_G0267514 [Dictyostelium discoideum] [Rhizoctonia solani]
MTSYPSPRTPTSPQIQTPTTPGRRRVRFDADAPNPSIRFIPPTPLSPVLDDSLEDFSQEARAGQACLTHPPRCTHLPAQAGPLVARRWRPTTPLAYDDSDPFNRYTLENDNDGYEVDMRPIVIPPPPYEHVWKDIYAANSAAYRLRTALLESKRVDDVLIYSGVSPSPVDPIPPMREPSPTPPPLPYSHPNNSGFTERERTYAPVPEHRVYTNPNSTFSPPVKSASPAPTTTSSHHYPTANPSPGPYINPNRLNDMTGSQSPYSGASSQGATPNLGSMPLVRRLDPTEVLSDPHGLDELASRGLDAVDSFMQVLRQDVATGHPESHRFREALVYLWSLTGHYPAERDITNEISRVGKSPIAQDAISFTQDIDTWRTLFHPNIHTFISCVIPRHGAFGLVMPIPENGSVIQYLLANPGADRTNFVIQAADGLRYLHEDAKMVHGDFRGVNLLVSDDDRIMVTGYGILPAIERNQELGFPEWSLQWGDARWMAPELHHHLNPKTKFPGQRTTHSDVYAFACTALEIWTSAAPFAGHPDASVVLEVANKGRHPPRPQNTAFISKSKSDQVWGLLQACWNVNPGVRPSIRKVLENLTSLAE